MTWLRSSTRRAPLAGPRAASSPTATCSPAAATRCRERWPANCSRSPAPRPCSSCHSRIVRQDHPGRLHRGRRGPRALAGLVKPGRRPAVDQAGVPARGARVFEKVFNTAQQQAARAGEEEDLPRGGGHRHRLQPRSVRDTGSRCPARCRSALKRGTRSSTASSTASSAPPSAARSGTRSPAARRSASGSAISSAGRTSPFSRATA